MFDMSQFVDEYATIDDLVEWAETVMKREPDFVIGGDYLCRWFVVPRNAMQNTYLHRTQRSDDDRALHDHPWDNVSVVISGGYIEITPDGDFERRPGDVIHRKAKNRHRLVLIDDQPAVTLFSTGPKIREWGFWCDEGKRFVHWTDFTDPQHRGNSGVGCGEQ